MAPGDPPRGGMIGGLAGTTVADGAAGPTEVRAVDLRVLRRWLGWWGACLGLWLVLSDKETVAELLTGGAAAAIAATVAEALARQADPPVGIRVAWLARGWRLPATVLAGTWRVLAALPAALAGRPPAAGFEVVAVDWEPAASDPTARALLVAARSASPDTVVLGWDEQRRSLLVHHLGRRR